MRTTPSISSRPLAAPPPLDLAISLTGEDRIAGMLHLYRDLIARQRRRILIFTGIALFLVMLGPISMIWSEGGRRNPGLLWRGFLEALAGPFGIFLAALVLIGGLAYLLHGLMMRSRIKRWLRNEGLTTPTPCQFRLHEGGLDGSEPHHASHVASWRLRGLAEGPEHLFVEITGIDELVALPQRELSAAQQAQARDWAAFCIGQANKPDHNESELLAAEPSGESALVLRFHLTPEDRVAAIQRQQMRLWPRSRHLRRLAIGLVLALLLVPAVMLFLWVIDPDRVPFEFALPLFAEMWAVTFWPVTAIVASFVLLGAVFNPWALRQQAKGLGKTLHQRAEDDAIEVTLSADGIASRQRGIAHRYDWAAFTGIERRGDHIFLVLRHGDPLLLPVRVLNSDQMQLFDRLTATHIGRSGEAA
ncbi:MULTISPECIES: YcxB family protein [unclassified Bosea (in: a-proteobacteria)]|uniref:YcxB family protein n=1 Tax=unclassified Bosea (in: a-proteobacteria) TaxID=2653178 RepID=UPI000F759424|nr:MULTISPECIES: YcxB family protein [unclassified Bosea (in: a-proteobacteria)]AZO78486.1 hypothetical protein BLM15_13325 [Bosea sp. Tri-49]RXT20021.1 hypothetical protein B5U98_18695 [Bosea sp. Tri-39]RXT36893.1 hypothetical protein B5U99_13015 [Bosea sp. Tri-54]